MELRGKTVLITRATSQLEELREGLSRLGAQVIECPTIQIAPVEDPGPIDRAIREINSYQWLLFTSANAVVHFMKRVEASGRQIGEISIAVVGSATAKKLGEWRLTASAIPEDYRAEGLLNLFPSNLTGVRILFPRAETARELLPEELRRRGAVVDVLAVYRTIKAEGLPNLKQLLRKEHVDCVVFTSPSTVRFMAETLEDELEPALAGAAIAVIGPVTEQAVETYGLKASIRPVRATAADLIEAIRNWWKV
jgi:uroporphyrinogen III methyltransferase/synthase